LEFQWGLIQRVLPFLLHGAVRTLEFTTISVFLGLIIGLLVALARLSKNRLTNATAGAYVEFFRGTPLLAQLFLIHFGLPQVFKYVPNEFASGIVALTLNASAYIAEIYRGGIQSIERGQTEASRSLGMTYFQSLRYVILPQAIRRCIPPLGNEYIAMLKDSSLVSIISLRELMYSGRLMSGSTYFPFEIYSTVAIIYLVMTLTFSRFVHYSERRLRTSGTG